MIKLKQGRVRQLRERKCWSQEDLAAKAGVSVRTLQRLETGEAAKLNTVAFVAEALEVPPDELIVTQGDDATAPGGAAGQGGTNPPALPHIPAVLNRLTTGAELLATVGGSMAMHSDVRGQPDADEADDIGFVFDGLRDFMDISAETSMTDRLKFGVELTDRIADLAKRGWWLLAGTKRLTLRTPSVPEPMEWATCVVLVARADDSIITHREDGQPVALVLLPRKVQFA